VSGTAVTAAVVAGVAVYDAAVSRIVPAVIVTPIAVLLSAATVALAAASGFTAQNTTPTAAAPPPAYARLHAARTFSFALGARLNAQNVTRLSHRDLVVVDGEDASAADVVKLKARSAIVLGYLSVGSVESWRSWFPLLKEHRLEPLGDWDGERYADVSNAELRDALADTIAPSLLRKGFDGLFLDLVDMTEDHPAQADGMYDVVSRIAARVHGAGGLLMAQNGDGVISRYLPLLDAWNREDPTGTYDFAHERYVLNDPAGRRLARAALSKVQAAGLVTTTTDYFATPAGRDQRRAIHLSCSVGAIPTIGDIALRKVPKTPIRCPTD
jgi:endo-alpha-1,4-polygalactosaminidase (GH114 family)